MARTRGIHKKSAKRVPIDTTVRTGKLVNGIIWFNDGTYEYYEEKPSKQVLTHEQRMKLYRS